MKTIDVMQRLAQIHNRIMQVSVSGESAILIADTIVDIRSLLRDLENDAKNESAEKTE